VVFHYEEALYQVYAPLPYLTFTVDVLPLPRYYRTLATVPVVLSRHCIYSHGNYRGITAFPITVSFSSAERGLDTAA